MWLATIIGVLAVVLILSVLIDAFVQVKAKKMGKRQADERLAAKIQASIDKDFVD
jgi:uncharacterized membrane protein